MKQIFLTKNYVALVDDDRYEELDSYLWYAAGAEPYVYAARRDKLSRELIYMHNQVLGVDAKKIWPNRTDHINRNRLDNQRANLRTVTASENGFNSALAEKGRGVGYDALYNRWKAYAKGSPRVNIGTFKTEEEALEAVRRYYENLRVG